jgi:nucleotide-binding universal stress UspA family protein
MTQKILIAMDDSQNALRAVRFVARSFSTENHITLFSVMLDTATLCSMDSPELTPLFKTHQSDFCALENKKRELVTNALHLAKEELVAAGFAAERIKINIRDRDKSVAQDIIKESRQGYDLIVIGRHGVTGIKDFFLGSTSQKVFNGAREISVLIVN